jgi:Secretion system C-terminal sorting domain
MRNFVYVFIFASLSSFAQQKYVPFIGEDKYWIYSQTDDADIPNSIGAFIITFGSDTMVNGIDYTKLIYLGLNGEHPSIHKPCFVPYYPYQINANDTRVLAYIREDTVHKKVFCLPNDNEDHFCDSEEHLLLDFNQKVGDTISQCNLVIHSGWPITNQYFTVDSIKMEDVYGQIRKTFYFNGYLYGGLPIIVRVRLIEGIGLENNLHFYIDQKVKFIDFCEGTLVDCNIISSIKDTPPSIKYQLTITPNPTTDFINISSALEILKMEVIDRNGNILLTSLVNDIDVRVLSPGFYYLRCIDAQNQQYYVKFVKI